jgi:hypothetical protein
MWFLRSRRPRTTSARQHRRMNLVMQVTHNLFLMHFSIKLATSIGLWLFPRRSDDGTTCGRLLDLQKFYKPWNFRCGSTVIISGFGDLKFRGVIFDGFQPASCILDHNGLNGHSRPLLWGYRAETTPQYSPETHSTHIWGTMFWLEICQPYCIVRPGIDIKRTTYMQPEAD